MKHPDWYIPQQKLHAYIEPIVASGDPFAWLFIGRPGCGKTAAAEVVYNHIAEQHDNDPHFSAIGISAQSMYAQYLKASALDGKARSDEIAKLERYLSYDLVVLDDLGTEMDTPAARAYFANLIAMQYERYREGKFNRCIITTNLSCELIGEIYGERIIDRLVEFYTLIPFSAASYRKKQIKVVKV